MEVIQSAPSEFAGAERPFKKVPAILLDSLVEEPRKPNVVPNHLLESKIYTKLLQNTVIQAEPAVLHYGGYEINRHHQQTLQTISLDLPHVRLLQPVWILTDNIVAIHHMSRNVGASEQRKPQGF
uniref:Uncharacterized protein n=1 Tax=Crocodylus porosus TaxID=8502 RepID=A0A7M4E597_CROPO